MLSTRVRATGDLVSIALQAERESIRESNRVWRWQISWANSTCPVPAVSAGICDYNGLNFVNASLNL